MVEERSHDAVLDKRTVSAHRTIVIGDVHGCLEELDELLRLVDYRAGRDDLGFVGDLVDRGPDSLGVVRRVRELAKHGAWCVLGNHDEKHVRFRRHAKSASSTTIPNPVKFSAKRNAEHWRLTDEDVQFLASLPLTHWLEETLVVVHAGFSPKYPMRDDRQTQDICTRIRYVDSAYAMVSKGPGDPGAPPDTAHWATHWSEEADVIYGHHVVSLTNVVHNSASLDCGTAHGIDTGCCYGGRLTAMVLRPANSSGVEVPEVVQVQAKAKYANRLNIRTGTLYSP